MRILILSQYCSPEPDSKKVPFAKKLKELGHEVEILTGFPNYPTGNIFEGYRNKWFMREKIDNVDIIRVPLYADHSNSKLKRIWNYLSFALSALFFGVFMVRKPDVIYVFHAPATIAIPAIFFKFIFRSKILYDINDYWPDSLSASGMLNNKRLIKIVHKYCRITYRFFDHINVVTQGYKLKLIEDGVKPQKISVIYNWPHPYGSEFSKTFETHKHIFESGTTITYAGNIGKAQQLIVLLESFKSVLSKNNELFSNVKLIFIGSGVEKEDLKNFANQNDLNNVYFIDKVPLNELGNFLEATSYHFIHLKKSPLFEITIPSKLYSCLMTSKPIICGVSGETNQIINGSGAGFTFESGNAKELESILIKAHSTADSEKLRMGEAGKRYFEAIFSFESGTEKFNKIFTTLYKQIK